MVTILISAAFACAALIRGGEGGGGGAYKREALTSIWIPKGPSLTTWNTVLNFFMN